ncbi:UDP-N-acetylglucosamine 4,6-dehydratase [Jeotgalibacillus malaysiensis]|uniref:UDP-N-acetylglucosamine 4,6-dehydratase n=1 Tax=Jeotgalibacillus malaysiensis TaxID=1508404 RepID=A0A0B5AUI0_9BACL|nr:nucleoside-diphosphate sugar epimerase/dehydratase [Jeotgalibacillus malaysiensis]AJD92263.1 UDP-N-acetylglucosamine 4,6-dehydratase [Jeotgalibacillus malaysiensis]
MSYQKRLAGLMGIDSSIVILSIFISYYFFLPFGDLYGIGSDQNVNVLVTSSILLLITHHIFAHVFGLYKRVWQYSSLNELMGLVKAVTLSVLVVVVYQLIFSSSLYTRTLLITWMLHILLLGGVRFSWRMYRDTYFRPVKNRKRTLIVGAGAAGSLILRELNQNQNSELQPVGFIDDDRTKHHLEIHGVPVYGGVERIEEVVEGQQIEHIIIAIPSLDRAGIKRIFAECAKTNAETKILPLFGDLASGRIEVNAIREVQVEDLLGRDPVELDMQKISEDLTGKTILVTGAGGSIGSEISRQVCRFSPAKLILLGHGENSIYKIDMELRSQFADQIDIVPTIADVQDGDRILEVMKEHKPDVVYHAAAHKHVPLMEANPFEAVKNNIFGTKNVATAAHEAGVGHFVLVSTDKAVNPPNVMGATKRFAEMIIQNLAEESDTVFAAVRFGNVLGSRGSVIPLFKRQIAAGGPVTVTDPRMTRYFMTIPEASRLVIQAGTLARGGEVFVLDMGEPVKIVDLAKNLIRLSGYTEEEIPIKFAGMRPGEKLYEELLNEDEVQDKQVFEKIFIGKAVPVSNVEMELLLREIQRSDEEQLKEILIGVANRKNVERLKIKSS